MIRLIIVSNNSGSKEDVIFTEDYDTPATDYCTVDQEVTFDDKIEADLPTTFPLEYTLHRD